MLIQKNHFCHILKKTAPAHISYLTSNKFSKENKHDNLRYKRVVKNVQLIKGGSVEQNLKKRFNLRKFAYLHKLCTKQGHLKAVPKCSIVIYIVSLKTVIRFCFENISYKNREIWQGGRSIFNF